MTNYETKYYNLKFASKVSIALFLTYILAQSFTPKEEKIVTKTIIVENKLNLDTFSEKNLLKMINLLEIQHPDIVLAQAKLETGNFTAPRFKKYNALFGFQTSDTNIMKYSTWKESVIAYKSWQMKRLKEREDYYSFLKRIKYAADTNYIPKLKRICIK